MNVSNKANLDNVRGEIENEIKRLETTSLAESDYLRPSNVFNRPMNPSEILELWDKLGIRRTMENYSNLIQEAATLKRLGDLNGANQIYINIFRSQKLLDNEYIWPWCKIMILAKNFADLDVLLRFLYAFNIRENITEAESHNGRAVYSFDCNTALYLRDLCDSALANKDEVSWRFTQYGGSDHWKSYCLSDEEYRDFLKYFSLEKAGIIVQPPQPTHGEQPTTTTTTKRSEGCYIATAVYGSYECPEVWTLRRYRDKHLATSRRGRMFIAAYYAISPWMVKYLGASSLVRRVWKMALDYWIVRLRRHGYESSPYSDISAEKGA